ncbi:Eukaryotic translation initiation factor 3 subunit D [Neolecta irregularis DAH-3]|uniref:Eukaryotic translation initiation factor 3 subunit D n=1 Tax=Neolecta irregularis (strain DAH-3) TaxID=1198029 RepID=A0A1U7LVS5_NEOID|nr:Eukaryotic translation initiation factor 3 subunit D [Neolecta irregularis DAH-3]|eukprot:OLL26767.1 Eukaryotic translation initiation factor 3 subunit D [Neolecta irregularis DAH-3]
MTFALPEFPKTLGWGPPATAPEDDPLADVPYAPYSKGDKLGKIADWTADGEKDRRDAGRQQRGIRDQYQAYGAGLNSVFAFQQGEEEEGSFSVVDNKSSSKAKDPIARKSADKSRLTRGSSQPGRGGRSNLQRLGGGRLSAQDNRRPQQNNQAGRGRRMGWKDYDKPTKIRDASINIKPTWKLVDEIEFNRLSKLNLDVSQGEDVETYGSLNFYDKSYDKIAPKTERIFQSIDRVQFNPTTTDDPVIQKLAQSDTATIFATDNILSLLMCAPRSVLPWDIIVHREGNKLFLDKRENGPFDYVTVNENAANPPQDDDTIKEVINTSSALRLEATYIVQNFGVQVVSESTQVHKFQHPDPFYNESEETDPLANKGYRYRRFDLSISEEEPLSMIVRTEIDAVLLTPSGETQFLTIKALNEFDSKAAGSSGIDWRAKLDSQRGAVVATEMKNNNFKLARWAVQSYLAGADQMKLGLHFSCARLTIRFVSRMNPKDATKHSVVGVCGYRPRDFASQMNLNISNGWGIVRTIVDMCMKMPEGKSVLIKDPNRPLVRVYSTGEEEEDFTA